MEGSCSYTGRVILATVALRKQESQGRMQFAEARYCITDSYSLDLPPGSNKE